MSHSLWAQSRTSTRRSSALFAPFTSAIPACPDPLGESRVLACVQFERLTRRAIGAILPTVCNWVRVLAFLYNWNDAGL